MNSCVDWSTLGYETIFTPLGSFTLSLSFHVSLVSWQQTEGRVSAISLNSRLSIDFALQNSKKIVFDAESGMKRQQGQGQQFQTKLEKDKIAEWWCCGFKREGKKKWRTPLAGMLRNPALLIGRGTLPQTGAARINPHPGEE
jgi:hypothetical protein